MILFDRPEEFSVPVKRVRLDSLDAELTVVDGELFTGIGYAPTASDGFFLRPVRVVDGAIALGEEIDDPALASLNGLSVLDADRHPTYENRRRPGHDQRKDPYWLKDEYALDGVRFTGALVEFSKDGWLKRAVSVDKGQVVEVKLFGALGDLQTHKVVIVPDDSAGQLGRITQDRTWFRKSRRSGTFFDSNGTGLGSGSGQVGLDKDGRLSGPNVSGSYFELVEQFGDLLVYPTFRDFGFLDDLAPAGQLLAFGSDERSVDLADRLISNRMLDEVSLLYPSGADHRGLAILSAAEMPNLSGVVVEPGYGKDYASLIDILGKWRRRTGVATRIEHHQLRLVSELTNELDIHPANLKWESGMSFVFVDDDTAEVVGLMGLLGDGLSIHVLQSSTLRFVRSTHTRSSEELRSDPAVPPNVAVYGSEIEHEKWLGLVRQQLFDEGHLTGPVDQ